MLRNILLGVPTTLIAITLHELAHGWVSSKLGDPTPRMQGRLTLNPLAHLDPIGTLLMVITGFGWAKPVSVNPMYYKDRKKGMALVGLAGPLTNFVLAFVGMLIAAVISFACYRMGASRAVVSAVLMIGYYFASRNLRFMVFNMIPFPPLDGAKIFGVFMPDSFYYKMLQYEHLAMPVILILSISGVFDAIIGSGVDLFMGLIMTAVNGIIGLA